MLSTYSVNMIEKDQYTQNNLYENCQYMKEMNVTLTKQMLLLYYMINTAIFSYALNNALLAII